MLEDVRRVVKRWMDKINMETGEVTRVPGPIEDTTFSNGDPEEYYPIIGADLGTSDVAAITELKQEAAEMVRVRVIEFKAFGLTYTRAVHKADRAAMEAIKADIAQEIHEGWNITLQEILPTLRVRPGFVYA